jgi:hypothetical protein
VGTLVGMGRASGATGYLPTERLAGFVLEKGKGGEK